MNPHGIRHDGRVFGVPSTHGHIAGVCLLAIAACLFISPAGLSLRVRARPPGQLYAAFQGMEFPGAPAATSVEGFLSTHVVARDLQGPDGIAWDRATGDLYVTEEDAARVVRIGRDGKRERVITQATAVVDPAGDPMPNGLRSPEGIAITSERVLLVAEDLPGGRLVAFPIDQGGNVAQGETIDLGLPGHSYAWESVAVGPHDEILLAGSTLESAAGTDGAATFEGVILFRDGKGDWWMPYRRVFASFSAVCFSPDGTEAFYACEASGETGRINLETQELQIHVSDHAFNSPEGVCALPDGSLLVAEESGRIRRLDWRTGTIDILYAASGGIESLLWNPETRQVIFTEDTTGTLVCTEPLRGLAAAIEGPSHVIYDRAMPPHFIPAKCPRYLEKVLMRVGFDPRTGAAGVTFRELAGRLSLVSIDAEVSLLQSDAPVDDPIDHVQFAVFSPNLMGLDMSGFTGPASGFAARKRSGSIVHSEMVDKHILKGNMLAGAIRLGTSDRIAVPFPSGARMASDGIASVHFMGMGHMPDYSVVINPLDPGKSYMVVTDTSGHIQQYRLKLPKGTDRNHWVVGLPRKAPDTWLRLAPAPPRVASCAARPQFTGS